MKIFYVHHALRAVGNPPSQDDDIEQLGVEDAQIVSELFKIASEKLKIKAIYTSPYLRCKKTSEIINRYINVPIYDEPRFNEFGNVFSVVQGKKTIEKKESWLECQLRIREAIKDIVYKYDDDDVLICVTSGVNITAFIGLSFKIEPSEDLPLPMVPSCSPIGFDIDKSCFDNCDKKQ